MSPTTRNYIRNLFAHILTSLPMPARKFLRRVTGEIDDIVYLSHYINDKTSHVKIGDTSFSLRLMRGRRDAHSTHSVLQSQGEIYEEVMIGCLSRILELEKHKEPAFIDAGAFMGYYTCFVSAYLDGQIKAYAVESNKECCEYVRQSIRENGFQNAIAFNEALSDKAVEVYVWDKAVHPIKSPKQEQYAGLGISRHRAAQKQLKDTAFTTKPSKRTAITLDDLCEREGITPTIIKIDIDGAEGNFFRGSTRCLRDSIRWILMELHGEDRLREYSPGCRRADVLGLLECQDFDCYLVGGYRGIKLTPEKRYFLTNGKPICIPLLEGNIETVGFDRQDDVMVLAVSKKVPQPERSQVFDVLNRDLLL